MTFLITLVLILGGTLALAIAGGLFALLWPVRRAEDDAADPYKFPHGDQPRVPPHAALRSGTERLTSEVGHR